MSPQLLCIRVLAQQDKKSALSEAVKMIASGQASEDVFSVFPSEFREVPGAPFAYWVGPRVRQLFAEFPAFEGEERSVKQGLATGDDFRFVRTAWEVQATRLRRTWFPFAKGGNFSPFYSDFPLVVNWGNDGEELKCEVDRRYSHIKGYQTYWVVKNPECYFFPGITWPLRSSRFSPQVMPAGCIFSARGYAAQAPASELGWLLGLLASSWFDFLFKVLLGRFEFPEFIVGILQKLPVPSPEKEIALSLERLSRNAWALKRSLDTAELNSHAFTLPALLQMSGDTLVARADNWSTRMADVGRQLADIQTEIDAMVLKLYGLSVQDSASSVKSENSPVQAQGQSEPDENEMASVALVATTSLTASLVDYIFGLAFGRWDVLLASGKRSEGQLHSPFDQLPVSPNGLLQNRDHLPMNEEDVRRLKAAGEWCYPLDLPWDGMLVDDPDHPDDIEARVRTILQLIWPEAAQAIEQEACDNLGVSSLREYFRKPTGFFAGHLKRYSKSQRQAPLYWPLSTESGSYTVWIYYCRLHNDSLFTVLNKLVKPKIEDTDRRLREIEPQLATVTGREGSKLRVDYEQEKSFLKELVTFHDELLRVAQFPYKPNLDDGALITASPLFKVFRLPKWRKDLEKCWRSLEEGEYDWAHLAYSIWPDRVRAACKKHRPVAIAHGLEKLCEAVPKAATRNRATKNKSKHVALESEE